MPPLGPKEGAIEGTERATTGATPMEETDGTQSTPATACRLSYVAQQGPVSLHAASIAVVAVWGAQNASEQPRCGLAATVAQCQLSFGALEMLRMPGRR